METQNKSIPLLESILFDPIPRSEINTVIGNIAIYDQILSAGLGNFKPTKTIIHKGSSLLLYAPIFKMLCDELDKQSGLPANATWELGIYPFAKMDDDGKYQISFYFIPTLRDKSDKIFDFRTHYYEYYNINYDFIYDLGNVYP